MGASIETCQHLLSLGRRSKLRSRVLRHCSRYLWLHGSAFNLAPGEGFGGSEAGAIEILYTFMLCFVVLNVAATKANSF